LKVLIIAAGKGERLKPLIKDLPKPLTPLLGLSLIERVILTCRKTGFREFLVVVGFKSQMIKNKIGNGQKYKVNIGYIENNEWTKGNGISVLKAKDFLKEEFILLMADHIFDVKILEKIRDFCINKDECVLAIDKNPTRFIDIQEATKVKTEGDYIIDIGKNISDYDGLDCGIFKATPVLFEALEESVKKGAQTLTDGIRLLAKNKRMRYLEIEKDNFWIDIDTPSDLKKAEKILCKDLVKLTDGPISRFLNRPISIRISKFLVRTEVTPNFISFLSFGLSIISAWFFSLGDYLSNILAGVIAQLSSIIDGCDGEIARLKFKESKYGAWFDAVLDRYADALIIIGMTIGIYRFLMEPKILITGFLALTGSFMMSYTADKYDSIFRKKKVLPKVRLGRDVRLFLIMIGAFFNKIFLTLFILALFSNLEVARRLYIVKKKKEEFFS